MDAEYVLTQSAQYEMSDHMLERLEKEFEHETPVAEASTKKSLVVRRDELMTEKLADPRISNQRPQKRRSSLPPSYLHPEAQHEQQSISSLERDRVAKAPSPTRQASPSQIQSPAAV